MKNSTNFYKLSGRTLPFLYLSGLMLYWLADTYFAINSFNYVSAILLSLLTAQFFLKNKILGLSLGLVILVSSVIMFLAVISEYYNFKLLNAEANKLLIYGCLLSFGAFVSSTTMTVNNLKRINIRK
ncbi:MAG: hypothetical protein EOO87_13660 [Pedobacter sp.]|nr:MAG: hypothetical protein EOO87_13660 [Pedobacter sp.]